MTITKDGQREDKAPMLPGESQERAGESLPRGSQRNYNLSEFTTTKGWGCQAQNWMIPRKMIHTIKFRQQLNDFK